MQRKRKERRQLRKEKRRGVEKQKKREVKKEGIGLRIGERKQKKMGVMKLERLPKRREEKHRKGETEIRGRGVSKTLTKRGEKVIVSIRNKKEK